MHSIELKFDMYIIGHHRTNATYFGECRMYSSFTEVQNISYTLQTMESNSLKGSSIQTVYSIELKLSMFITELLCNLEKSGKFIFD